MISMDRDLGIIAVLLKRLETECLPAILSMQQKVQAGETLGDGDLECIRQALEDATADHLGPLLERHPEYQNLAAAVFAAYRRILEQDLANEPRVRPTVAPA